MSTSPATFSTLSPPPRSVKRHVKAAYAATAPRFQNALTTNRLRGRAPGYNGQTQLCARLRGVLRLHENQCREEFSSTPLYSFWLHADSIGNNRGRSFPHDRPRNSGAEDTQWQPFGTSTGMPSRQDSQQYILRQLWMIKEERRWNGWR